MASGSSAPLTVLIEKHAKVSNPGRTVPETKKIEEPWSKKSAPRKEWLLVGALIFHQRKGELDMGPQRGNEHAPVPTCRRCSMDSTRGTAIIEALTLPPQNWHNPRT
jgi:hypothetical protein